MFLPTKVTQSLLCIIVYLISCNVSNTFLVLAILIALCEAPYPLAFAKTGQVEAQLELAGPPCRQLPLLKLQRTCCTGNQGWPSSSPRQYRLSVTLTRCLLCLVLFATQLSAGLALQEAKHPHDVICQLFRPTTLTRHCYDLSYKAEPCSDCGVLTTLDQGFDEHHVCDTAATGSVATRTEMSTS